MKTQLLVQMLELANKNRPAKPLTTLLLQIELDSNLGEEITIDSFSNEFYDVRSLQIIHYCLNFNLTYRSIVSSYLLSHLNY